MTSPRALAVAVLFLVGLAGCGGGAVPGIDGGSPDAGGACNALVNNAPSVSKDVNAGPPPAMTGGTVMDGTWFLTKMDRYNGSTGSSTHKETWVFSGSTVEIVTDKSTDAVQKHFSATYAISGSSVTLTVSCPSQKTLSSPFTASGSLLQVINSDDANEMHTFTRQ